MRPAVPHRLSHRRRIRRGERGLTVIEIVLVMVIVILLVSMVGPAINNVTRAHLKSAATSLAGTIRYAYAKAALEHAYFRIVFDFADNSYQVEYSDGEGRFLLSKDPSKNDFGLGDDDELDDLGLPGLPKPDDDDDLPQTSVGGFSYGEAAQYMREEKVRFSSYSDTLVGKVNLPDGTFFDGIWTVHRTDRTTEGKEAIHFYPNGQVDKAVIHIADQNGTIYTLVTRPLTGRVKIFNEYIRAEDFK